MEEKRDIKTKLKDFWKDNENKIIIGIIAFATILRLYYFNINSAIWWDEADYLLYAKKLLGLNNFYELNPRRPLLLPLLWGFIIKFGGTETILHFTELIFSIFGVLLTYSVGKEMYNKKIGLIAAFAMSVFWLHLFFTARLLTGLPATTFWLASIFYFWKAHIKKQDKKYYYLFGLFLGLAILTRGASALLIATFLIFLLITEKLSFLKNKQLWISLIIFLIVIAPFFLYMQTQTSGNIISKYAGVSEGRFSQGMGLPGLLTYTSFLPTYLYWPYLIVFLFGLGIILLNIILSSDMILKNKTTNFDNDIFSILWILIPLLFFSIFVIHMEPRYLLFSFPAVFMILGKGLIKIEDYLKKYKKEIATATIIGILILGAYYQLNHTNEIVNIKKDSYLQVKQSGLWLKKYSNPEDIIFSKSLPQHVHYAEREVKGISSNITEFEQDLKKYKPKYLVVSIFEQHPQWIYAYPEKHNSTFMPVQAYFLDKEKTKPALIIYQVNY